MKHAIETLQKERDLLEKCLKEGDWSKYPAAKKDRERKLREVQNAINYLEPFKTDYRQIELTLEDAAKAIKALMNQTPPPEANIEIISNIDS